MNCKNWLFSLLALWLTMQSAYATEGVSAEITETSYALRVNTIPQGAEVKILNIVSKFKQGMLLPAGKYDLKVSKAGYPTRALQVEIIDKNVAVDVVLGIVSSKDIPIFSAQYALFVNTIPQDADIKIMNISPEFYQGIVLAPGKYDIRIAKSGYATRDTTVTITDSDATIDVELLQNLPTEASETDSSDDAADTGDSDITDKTMDIEEPTDLTAADETTKSPVNIDNSTIETVKEQYGLYIDVIPEDASIKLVDSKVEFKQGLLLDPGKYTVVITKSGYQSVNQAMEIVDDDVTLNVELKKEEYALSVKVVPEDAIIKIMNIKPKFTQGLLLASGSYTLNVSKEGYETYEEVVKIIDKAVTVEIELIEEEVLDDADDATDENADDEDSADDTTDDAEIDDNAKSTNDIVTDKQVDKTVTNAPDGNTSMTIQAVETKEAVVVIPTEPVENTAVDTKKTDTNSSTIQATETKEAVVVIPTEPVENTAVDTKKTDTNSTSATDKSSDSVKKEETPVIKPKGDDTEVDTKKTDTNSTSATDKSSDSVKKEETPVIKPKDDDTDEESDNVNDNEAEDDDEAGDEDDTDDVGDDEAGDDADDIGDDEASDEDDADDVGDDEASDEDDGEFDGTGDEEDDAGEEASADDKSDIRITADSNDNDEETDTKEEQTEVATHKVDLSKTLVATDEQKVVVKPVETMTAMADQEKPVTQSTPIKTEPATAAVPSEQGNSENTQIASIDKSSSNQTLKAPIAKVEILCFAFEETRQVKDQTDEMTIIHNSIIKLDNRFVEAVYDVYIKPSNLSYHYDFKGVKKGEKFDLIGILHYDAREQDVNSDMSIENKKLTINIKDGSSGDVMSNDVLKQTSCSDVISHNGV